jgi:hypothetical protein
VQGCPRRLATARVLKGPASSLRGERELSWGI